MGRVPHLPQIVQGPLGARPSAARTPDWVWYFAWDDDGGAFWRPTPQGWVKATPSVGVPLWKELALERGWRPAPDAQPRLRTTGNDVELAGGVISDGGVAGDISVLPDGFRPDVDAWFSVVTEDGLAALRVQRNGRVTMHPTDDEPVGAVRLDGVRFSVVPI